MHFLEFHGKHDLLQSFTLKEFQLSLAYLVDIFESLDRLNLLFQGKNTYPINILRVFIAKLGLWHCRAHKENVAVFPNLDAALKKSELDLKG